MNPNVIQWFSAAYAGTFWAFLIVRVVAMWRRGVSVLTIVPRRPILNALAVVGFIALLAAWTGLFVYLAFVPSAFVLLRPLWNLPRGAGVGLAWAGMALAVAGQGLMWVAILTMGRAWRVGIDTKTPDALVTHGVFRMSRNPIFLGWDVAAVAMFLVQPNGFLLGFAALLIVLIHFQILSEERHLTGIYGDEYVRYRERTPRYLLFL
ncbi:MAG: methyltransferase family protein [Planctomycetota bacterium]|jgi:protein-S-isoprenylcysteine O-methyltransferase Ste14